MLNILGKKQDSCPLSSRISTFSQCGQQVLLIISHLKQFQEISLLSLSLMEAPVELAHSSFLNYVWPTVSTPAAVFFNLLIHLMNAINQVQPSIWLI